MEESYTVPDTLPWVALLILVWTCLGVWFWGFGGAHASVYASLLYVSFLGVVELGSALGLQLPNRRLLNLTIAAGFGGWVLSISVYLLG
ncbi:MAG: hypothetical protein V5A27_03320 [Halapricum sp.]